MDGNKSEPSIFLLVIKGVILGNNHSVATREHPNILHIIINVQNFV